jgi:tRNA (guanine37-N1)-methyltransferase
MNISLVSLFPELIHQAASFGVLGRAIKQQQLTLTCFNPRDYAEDKHRTVDDRPYGGGPGMLMKVEPLYKAIMAAKESSSSDAKVVYMSPQGQRLNQQMLVSEAATAHDLILIAGRYEGIDERIIESLVDEEWSIGVQDSFMRGLLDYPHYTRPERVNKQSVPDVLLSGDHEAIRRWRLKQALGRTWSRRPDMIDAIKEDASNWDEEKENLLAEYITEFGTDI